MSSRLVPFLVVLALLVPSLALAQQDGVRTYYFQPPGGGRDGLEEEPPRERSRVAMERSDGNPEISLRTGRLAAPLDLAGADTFRVVLPERTPLVSDEFETHVRVLELDAHGNPIFRDGARVVLGEGRFVSRQEAAAPQEHVDDAPLEDDWSDLRFALDPALLADGRGSYRVPAGHALALELEVRTPGHELPSVDDTYREDVLPVADVALDAVGERGRVHVDQTVAGRRVLVDVDVVEHLRWRLFNDTTFRGLDGIFVNPLPVSYFEYGSEHAPARLEIRTG